MMPYKVDKNAKIKILKYLGKTTKDLEDCVEIIKVWLKKQKHLPEIPNTNMIEFALVNNKFSIENAKKKLDMYYTIRSLIPEIYDNINPKLPKVLDQLNSQYIVPIPKLLDDLHRILILKLKPYKSNFDANYQIANVVNLYEIRTQEDFMLSDIVIFDLENLVIAHVYKTTFMHAKIATTILEKVYSNRVKEVHVINHSPVMDILLKMAKAILKPKLIKRIRFHDSIASLSKYIPLELLPADYGGQQKSLHYLEELVKRKLTEYADRFDKLDTLRVNESLRSSPLADTEKFGVEGTFRKLNVD